MVSKLKEMKKPTRKKFWWLLFLIPIFYVIADNLIFPIDEKALLKRPVSVELYEMAEEDYEVSRAPEEVEEPENGWETFDRVWLRVERAWPLVMSVIAFFWRRKLVGDHD